MNLLFRLIWIMLKARFGAKHAPLTDPSHMTFRVWLTDQDMFMHMTNSRYLSFSDLGRVNLNIRSGLRDVINEKGWRSEICGQTMTINRMLKAPQAFQLETRIQGWNDRYLVIGQRFLRNGRNHASVATLLELRDKAGHMVAPQTLIDVIETGLQSPELSDTFSDLIESTRASRTLENK